MNLGFKQDLVAVREYYQTPRPVNGGMKTVYDIWEQGGAFEDSITPSTYCAEYQSHILLKLQSLAPKSGKILSVGCGNAAVEAQLVKLGYTVRAMDVNPEAVALARSKGIDAFQDDFMLMKPAQLADINVVYADGLVGHLVDPDLGLRPFAEKLGELEFAKGTKFVISNDAPRRPFVEYEAHERVQNFWFVSVAYLTKILSGANFDVSERYTFQYFRPKSGMRDRTICVALKV
jgi:SAM-dependent methyltransferase